MKYKIRSLFIPSPGYTFLAMDLSQAETWVVAYLANEPKMKDALLNSDIHTITAAGIFLPQTECFHDIWENIDGKRVCKSCQSTVSEIERYLGKRSNHGNSYRMSADRWTQVINADSDKPPFVTVSLAQAKAYRLKWLRLYPGVVTWWKEIEGAMGRNRTLKTTYGRKRTFGGIWGDSLFKEATAYEPQSTVADHALGMTHPDLGIEGGLLGIAKHPEIKRHCKIVHTAHDSVMLEIPEREVDTFAPICYGLFHRPLVVKGESFNIPVDLEVGGRWGEMQKIKVA